MDKNIAPYEHALGKVPDSLIAEVCNMPRRDVSKLRCNRKIAAFPTEEGMWLRANFLWNLSLEEKAAFIDECVAA